MYNVLRDWICRLGSSYTLIGVSFFFFLLNESLMKYISLINKNCTSMFRIINYLTGFKSKNKINKTNDRTSDIFFCNIWYILKKRLIQI